MVAKKQTQAQTKTDKTAKTPRKVSETPKEVIEAVEAIETAIDSVPAIESADPIDMTALAGLGLEEPAKKPKGNAKGGKGKGKSEPKPAQSQTVGLSETARKTLSWVAKTEELEKVDRQLKFQRSAEPEERMEDVILNLEAKEQELLAYIQSNAEPEPMAYKVAINELSDSIEKRRKEIARDEARLARLESRYAALEQEAEARVQESD